MPLFIGQKFRKKITPTPTLYPSSKNTNTERISHSYSKLSYSIFSNSSYPLPPQLFCLSVPPRGYIHDGLVPSRCELLSPGPAIPIKRRRILVLLMDTRVRPRPSPPPCVNLCLKTGEGVVMQFICFIV